MLRWGMAFPASVRQGRTRGLRRGRTAGRLYSASGKALDPFAIGGSDRACRALRVMRLSLLAGELNGMHLSSSGALLSGAASIRLLQLVASVLTLLFTTSSIVHLVERIPFHDALYFVTTTLTTVRSTSPLFPRSICSYASVALRA